MPDGLPTDLAEIIAAALHRDMCGGDPYDGDPSVQRADHAFHESQAAAVLEAADAQP